ncbi:MAG: hypothetical protein NTW04_03975, partial [Elusimicrobia bacterium]|nr:hypothetical protein [Elusimicrobiota bacterium]
MNLILAALFFARLAYCQSADINWNKALSPNFEVNYQTQKPSALDLERIKSGVFMEMSSVTPVSFKEKIKIFIYDKKEDYLKDAIIPPQWSLGMADQQNGRIITYWEGNDIFPVIAHETAHIFFYS